jgi:aminopeptidase N
MRRFFDQWVFGPGHPEYQIRTWWDVRKKELNARVVQTNVNNESDIFHVKTQFLIVTKSKEARENVDINLKSHLFRFKCDSEPILILFDPDHVILKKVVFPKSESMLLVQLKKDKNPLGRIEAAQALAKIGSQKALEALNEALSADPFWGVSCEAAQAIGSMKTEKAAHVLIQSLDKIKHPKIRRAVYAGLRHFKFQFVLDEVEKRFRQEAGYLAQAEGIKILVGSNHPKQEAVLKEAFSTPSYNDVLKIAAIESCSAQKSEEALSLLIRSTRWGEPQRVRMAAIRGMAEFGAGTEAVQKRLLELLNDPYILVQLASVRALHQVGDERASQALKKFTEGRWDGRLMRLSEEAIAKIEKGFS